MGTPHTQIRWNGWGRTAHYDTLAERDSFWRWLADELGMPALLATPARALEDVALPQTNLTAEQIAAFAALLGTDRVRLDDHDRARHARGRSYQDLLHLRAGDLAAAPGAVLYPRGEDEVLAILQLAAREKIAVVPFGGGTNIVGGVTAGPGHVSVDLSGMDRILEVDAQNGTAIAEAGIAGPALEKALAAKGLALSHAPEGSEFSTLGGWIAAGGARADGLVSVRLATPQGVLDTQHGSGPNLNPLVLGSEGAFGIITRAMVRVRPAVAPSAGGFLFRDFSGGIAAIREAAQAPCLTLRLCDAEETRFERTFADLENPPGLVRRLKDSWLAARRFQSGAALGIAAFADAASASRFEALAKKHGAVALGEALAKRWLAERHLAAYRQNALLDRGIGVAALEFSASWSALPALYAAVRAALDKAMRDTAARPGAHGLVQCHIAQIHAGGASLNFTLLFPRQLENEIGQWQTIRRAGCDAALAHGGVHQGIGEDYLNLMDKGALRLGVLRSVKAALDPDGIMNPGKLIPPL